MDRRQLGAYQVHECERCHGAFIDHRTLELLQEGDAPAPGTGAPPRIGKPQRPTTPVVYIRCPGCAEVMNRVQFGRQSGIVVDVCRQHGTYFDPQELERAREWVSAAGLLPRSTPDARLESARAKRRRPVRKSSRPAVPTDSIVTADVAMLAVARAIAHWLRLR